MFAKWLASADNPFFARNLVNIIWAHFMGKGIVEPVDDVRASNPASNPELLDALAEKIYRAKLRFQETGPRNLCFSDVSIGHRANETNAGDTRDFSHAPIPPPAFRGHQ